MPHIEHYSVPVNKLVYEKFSQETFIDIVKDLSQGPCPKYSDSSTTVPNQVRYLAGYLRNFLDTQNLIIEHHYIDRHYLEEVSFYYSKCLTNYPNYCARIHCFSSEINQSIIEEIITQASEINQSTAEDKTAETSSDKYENARKRLQAHYQGYIVIRPIPSVPIGRTVLIPPSSENRRRFPTCVKYTVHFLGFDLSIKSTAFQQQDRAVAACATTSIWVALQSLCKTDGSRTPTTHQITEAAVRHIVPRGRTYPSSGLTTHQMCDALRFNNYDPEVFDVGGDPERFKLLLNIYLMSGIPVILFLVTRNREGHAITVSGIEKCDLEKRFPDEYSDYVSRNMCYDKIYIHDDRIGPYVSATFQVKTDKDHNHHLFLKIDSELLEVDHAIAPLYPKIRMNALELLYSMNIIPAFGGSLIGKNKVVHSLDLKFMLSGEYCKKILKTARSSKIYDFLTSAALSRYVGIISLYFDNEHIFDAIFDTTDTVRGNSLGENLAGMVVFKEEYRDTVRGLSQQFGIPYG